MSDDRITGLTDLQLDTLMRDLNKGRVQALSSGGRTMPYLAGYDVKATLIRVFGFGGFSAEVVREEIVDVNRDATTGAGQNAKPAIEVLASSTVRLEIPSLGAVYTETAVASRKGQQVGEVADFAMKTASTDALKRCATYLGTQFGLSLYDNGSTTEVVRRIVAPGQVWPKSPPAGGGPAQDEQPAPQAMTEEQKQMLESQLGAQDLDPAGNTDPVSEAEVPRG